MQINLLSLLGLAPPTAGANSAGPVPGEFAAFLQATQVTGDPPPPGVPAPPDLSSLVSAIGNEEVSPKQPNAGADQLDFLPKKAAELAEGKSVDSLLAAQFAWMVSPAPVVVLSTPNPTRSNQAVVSGGQPVATLPSSNSAPVFTVASGIRGGFPSLFVDKADPLQTKLAKPVEFAEAFSLWSPTPPKFEFSNVEMPLRPAVSTVQSGLQVGHSAPARPTVQIEGLVRQSQSGQQFDPKTLEVLKPTSVSGKIPWTLPAPPPNDADRFMLDRTYQWQQHENLPVTTFASQGDLSTPTPKIDVTQTQLPTPSAIWIERAAEPVTATLNPPSAQPNIQAVAAQKTEAIGTVKPSSTASEPLQAEADSSPVQVNDKSVQTKKPLESAVIAGEPVKVEAVVVEPIAKRPEEKLDDEAPPQTVSNDNRKIVDRSTEPVRLESKPALDEKAQREVMRQTIDRIDRMTIHRPMSQMVIRLSPENLGEITLTVRTMGVRSEADITATNERVVHALEANRVQLTQTIEGKGVNLGSLSLQFGGGKSDQAPANQQDFTRQMNLSHALAGDSSALSVETTLNETGSGSLNLVI